MQNAFNRKTNKDKGGEKGGRAGRIGRFLKDDPRRGNAGRAACLRKSNGVLGGRVHVFDASAITFWRRGYE